jgi:hypothetical protein
MKQLSHVELAQVSGGDDIIVVPAPPSPYPVTVPTNEPDPIVPPSNFHQKS